MGRLFAVVFAGVPGSSKSIVANYLSITFGLPIFNTDNIRYEVKEDLRVDDINIPKALDEYHKREEVRRTELLKSGKSFIFDGSVDRCWPELKKQLEEFGYRWFMVDMELSETFLRQLFGATSRKRFAAEELDTYLKQHEAFMQKYRDDISLQITDETFQNRLELAATDLRAFLSAHE